MKKVRTTDLLLFLILIALILNIFIQAFPVQQAEAESFMMDNCITVDKLAQPSAYLHVVTHEIPTEY